MKKTAEITMLVNNQRGMALISALLLLLVVSLMAVGVSMDTSMDVRIAAYQRFKARSFAAAESGGMAATDILEDNIYDAGWDNKVVTPGIPFSYPNLSPAYVADASSGIGIDILRTRKLDATANSAQQGVFYMDENPLEDPVMQMRGDISADIVTQRVISKLAKGGAIQMAAGYAGLGKGMAGGGAHAIYNFLSTGTDSGQALTDLGLHFRHVTK